MSLSKQDFNVADVVFKCKIELSNPRHYKDYVSETPYMKGRIDLAREILKLLEYTFNPRTNEVKHEPRR